MQTLLSATVELPKAMRAEREFGTIEVGNARRPGSPLAGSTGNLDRLFEAVEAVSVRGSF